MQKTLWFIWGALVYAILLYLGVAFFLVRTSAASPELLTVVAGLTILLSIISCAMSILVWIKLLRAPLQSGTLDLQSESGFQRYQTLSIITWALDETIAIFGLVLVVMSGVIYYAVPFCVISLVLLILQRPQQSATR